MGFCIRAIFWSDQSSNLSFRWPIKKWQLCQQFPPIFCLDAKLNCYLESIQELFHLILCCNLVQNIIKHLFHKLKYNIPCHCIAASLHKLQIHKLVYRPKQAIPS